MDRPPDGRIVVGVDGSPPSHAAARWAARLAALTRSPLEAVAVWEFPSLYGEHGLVPPPLDGFAAERAAARILDEALAAAAPGAPVLRHLTAGPPGPALVAAARGAGTLVLGTHGRTDTTTLGTVAQYCAHHAPCTVILVRPPPP